MKRETVHTPRAPQPPAPASQAVRRGEMIFVGLQTGVDPRTGELAGAGIADQAHRALCNLQAVLEAAGSSLAGATRVTVYLTDLAAFATVNEEYEHFFPEDAPARSTVEVAALPGGALVGVEAIALAH